MFARASSSRCLVRKVQEVPLLLGHLPLVQNGWQAYLQTVAADRRSGKRKETHGERSGSHRRLGRRPGVPGSQQRRQGTEEERDRVRLQRRDRRRLDRSRLQPRRNARLRSPPPSASSPRRFCSVSFVPMFLVAAGYYYMNKADPDCGTSFSWVTRAMGPQLGWITGWAIVRHRHRRDGQPRPDRRPLHLPPLRLGLGGRPRPSP